MALSLNGSTGISGVNGSADAPAIKGGDGDSGIFFGSDEAAITTGGTQRLTIDSTGAATFSSTVKTSKIENASTANGGVAIDSDGHVQVDGLQLPTDGPLDYRNLVYNGAAVINQRGSDQTVTAVEADGPSASYGPDGFEMSMRRGGSDGATEYVATIGQAIDAPEGFAYSVKLTCTTPETTVDAGEYYYFSHYIESFALQRLKWGTSNAKPLTLSFWVKSTVTGTFGFVAYYTAPSNRVFNASYTINSANTWEKKTIVIPASTATSVTASDGNKLWINWHIGVGSEHNTGPAATSWSSYATTNWAGGLHGTNDLVTTANSEWYITGVQLEEGEKATEFEHLPLHEDLARCYRYFYNPLYGGSSSFITYLMRYTTASNSANIGWFAFDVPFPAAMRIRPSLITDIADSNLIGTGPAGLPNWTFYRQNQAYVGGHVGTSDANVINANLTLNSAAVGVYYMSPDQDVSHIAIGDGMKFQFSAEL